MVSVEDVRVAKQNLLLRRTPHFNQVREKLREPRVLRVLEYILSATRQPATIPAEDFGYVRNLGLTAATDQLRIANPIYQEVITSELCSSMPAIAGNPISERGV
jgi:hypothetical protein